MTLPTCCEFHGMDECGCNQGRACPAHKPATKPDEPAIGYEAARLIQDEGGITYAGDEPDDAPYSEAIPPHVWRLLGAALVVWVGFLIARFWN